MREQNKLLVNKLLIAFLLLFVSKVSLAQCTTDLALGKAVTTSSVNANNYGYYATDGSTTTRWESAWSDPQWIMVDLGGKYPICSVDITWENARGADFLIQVSDDGSTWRTKATVTGNTALTNSYSFADTARYVRMYGTARVLSGYGFSIYTLQVMGTAPTTICSNTNVAQSRPGFASSVVGANTIANAFDNSATTRWESASSDPQYIYVDLGAQYDLCRVALTWEAAYGKDFTIDISTDGSTWTTAATIVGNYIKNNSIAISGKARYVRMLGTARGTTYGYSLYDFAVYVMLPALNVTKLTDPAEPGTGGSFRFSLPTGITYTEDITVNYTMTGTATSGTDYTSLPGSVVIPAGTNHVDVSYNTIDDKIIEGNETVIVTLTGGTSGSSSTYVTFPLSATNYSATGTITDDDNTVANMVLSLATTTSASEPSTDGVFTLSLPTGYTAKEDLTVSYTVAGTATAGTDYTTLAGTVVLPALSNSVPITVPVIDDKIIEGTETVRLTWTPGTGATLGTFGGSGIATMGLSDDDNVAANKVFTIAADGDAAEPSTNGAFKISLPAGVTVVEDVTVNYTISGTATPGADYTTLSGALTFPAGSNSVSLPVTVIDDNDIEATETVIATLTGGNATTFGTFTGTNSATINITDNDVVPAIKEVVIAATTNGAEPSANGVFTVSVSGGASYPEPITVNYTVSGTATSGSDFTALSGTMTIPAGSNSGTITVPVNDDNIIEPDETVIVTLTSASAPSFGTFIANTSATLTIADNEQRVLGINAASNCSEPSTNGTFAIALLNASSATEDITVNYTVTDITATVGDDYQPLSGTLTIPAGSPYYTAVVTVKDDNIIEGTENMIVTVTGGSSASLGTFTADATYASYTMAITDDEQKVVTIAKTADAAEPGTNGSFTVSLPAGTTAKEDVTVNYTVSGTATSGDDYTTLSGTATILAGDNSATILVEVIDDKIIENPETVTATLTSAAGATLGAFTVNGTATVNLTDDDTKTVTIAKTTDAAEPSANGLFTVSLPTGVTATEDITVTYSVTGTATAGTDYTALSGTVTIPAGDNTATINVPVLDDQIIEADETVIVTLTGATGATLGAFTANTNATVTIVDGANKTVTIAPTADGAEPTTNGSFTVSLPTGVTATEDITVSYTVTGTATAGADYTALSGTVTIPAGDNTATINVPVLDDQIIEGNETVIATLTGATTATLGSFTANTAATVTIADDEVWTVTIANSSDAAEPAASCEFTLNLPTGLSATEDITVYYTVTGTATPGSDYTSLSGVATIYAGANSTTIPLTVIDDQIIENNETVIVTLTNVATNNLGSFAVNATDTVNIADDDNKTISIAHAADAAEPSTNGSFTVSYPTNVTAVEDVTVSYTITGSATGGDDYTALSGTVTILAGNNSATISVDVADDQIIEGDETVTATLTGASGPTLGSFTAGGAATVTIADDDVREVTISNSADAAEPSANGAYIVSLPTGVTATENITVTYAVTGGTATVGDDYTALSGTATILAGDNSVAIPVVVVDDQIIEGDETVIVTLTGATAATLGNFTASGSATVTIADNESRTVTVTNTADAAEPGTTGIFTVSLPAGVTTTEDITVSYTVSGSATANDDYTALSGMVTIPAGDNNATIQVDVIDDQLLEGDETVDVILTSASAPTLGAFTANNNATVTIADNESKTVTIANNAAAAEPGTTGSFVISLPTGVTANEDISVTYTVTGSATAGVDYNTLSGTATILAGTNSTNLNVVVMDDQLLEVDETVIATLTGASSTTLGTFTANTSATVTIADDENKTVTLTNGTNGAEPSTNGSFTVSLPTGVTASEAITVTYALTGTATAGADYTALSGSVIIPAGDNSATISVNVLDDQIIEGDETVILTLTGASGSTLGAITANTYGAIFITDNELKTVSIANAADASEPATNGSFTVSLPTGITATEDITVNYAVAGTATAGADYTSLTGTATIPAGANNAMIAVDVLDDQFIEGNETVIATLMGATAPTLGIFTANNNATVTINDDETKTVTIANATDAAEPAASGSFTVSLPAGVTATEDVIVTYAVSGTATTGADYTTLSGIVVIPAGSNSATISVDVVDDQLIEGDETVTVSLTGATAPTLGTFTATNNATVTIADDENKIVTITNTADATEPATNGSFTVSLPTGVTATEDITVTYTVTGTATAGVDYNTLSGTTTILAGTNSTSLNVVVMDDQLIEGDETVIVNLTGASAPTLGMFTANTNATVTIIDDESKTITIAKTADAAEPTTNGLFTVSLPTGVTATEDITITYTVTGTATAGTDYTTLTSTATIPAGDNSATITVDVVDDQLIEGNETVVATLTGASAPTLGAFTANTNATVTITDDENKTITIAKTADAAEPTTNGLFTVSLPTGVTATGDITITYTVTGTATAGIDYTTLTGTAIIPAGDNNTTIAVDILDDQLIEGDETVIATLTGATAPTLGIFTANTDATVTIADDENKTISIANAANAAEPTSNGSFVVSLPTGVTATEDITVAYAVTGTATAGADYTTLSGTVVIPAGSNSTNIAVAVNDDQIIEADETVVVNLTGAATTLGTFSASGSATVTIADNESRTVTVANAGDAAEPATNGSFTVSLPAGVTATEDVTVTYTVSGTATPGTDYATLSGTVMIPAGSNSANISVDVVDDQLIESDETVIATLTGATAPTLGTFTVNSNATVTITDDENKTITITNGANASEPGTNGSFTVSLPTGVTATEDILVTYTVTGTATAGADYTTLSGTVTVPAGTTSTTIPVVIQDDQIMEPDETVIVTLTGATATTLGTFTAIQSASVNIADNDAATITIAKTADAAEPSTNGSFTVSYPTNVTATEDVMVSYTITGTATAGADYTTLTGTVTIPAGQNNATIPVNVIDDNIYEDDEDVIVTLSNAFGAQLGTVTVAGNATVTISDDDIPTLTVTKTADAAEPATNGVFTVSMPTGVTSTHDITLNYTVTGTATAGIDYTTLSGTVIIPAGNNSATISVGVIDDQIIEGDETVTVTITDATASSATLTIVDDENKTISITKSADAAEPATNGSFTVSLPTGITATEDITVTYTVTGTATAGTDYTTLSSTVVIPAGANSTTISVNVIDDQIIESDETVIATLTGATAPTLGTFTVNSNATVTITDDEDKTISIANGGDASEPATNGAFTVSLPGGLTAAEDVSVTYTVTGTATAGIDYTTLSSTVVIPAGANSTTISVNVIDDQIIEPDETVIVTMTGATASTLGTFIANTNAIVTIADDENKTVSIANTMDASEPATNGTFTVSLPAGVTATEDIAVTYTVAGTATAGTDYTTLSGTVVIPAGSNSATISVNVVDDQLIEANETVIVTLTGATAPTLGIFTANTNATVTIADDENKIIGIANAADAAEPATNGSFTVSLPTGVTATEDVTVSYAVTGTANAGIDYSSLSGTILIPAGSNSASISVDVIDDQIIEANETVIVTLTGATAPTRGTFTANTNATITIADDENKTISIANAGNAAEPATNGSFTITLSTGVTATEDVTVSYTVTGTATAGTDYTTLSGIVVIPASSNSATISVNVIDDQIIEANETVIVTLTGAAAPTLGTFTANTDAIVTIADDENKTISITKAVDASEPATNGALTVSLPTGITASEDITVTYTVAGTATAGADYTTLSGTVTIPAGSNNATISVNVIDDQLIEADKTVIVTLTGATAATLGTFTANTNATVTIADNEDKSITITNGADAAEPATNGAFTVSLPTGVTATEDITVTYTVAGTATAGTDYTTLSGTVIIPVGNNSANISVDVIDDQLIEANETVIVTLTGAAAPTLGTFTANTNATVTIADDEDKTITIANSSDAAEPATNGAFTVSLPTGVTVNEDITVTYSVSGTAIPGADYNTLSGTVIIPAGNNSTTISVVVKDDQIIEGNETVIATLASATGTTLGAFTAISNATVTIADNDIATFNITKTTDAAEPSTNGVFTVSLPTGVTATTDLSVPYTVTGTATAGVDYSTLSGTLLIPAGQNSATINVIVIDDKLIEGNETITLTLADITKTATLTIADDDNAIISIAQSTNAAEPSTNGSFTVSLPTGVTATTDITVPYTVSGTATAGTDYTALTGSVVIPGGQNSAAIVVNVLDDLLIEGDETVIVTLADVTKTATVTIIDNDAPAFSIVKTTDAAEPSTNGSFTVSYPGTSNSFEDVTITYTVSGTATAGKDYNALTGSVVIPAGQNSATIAVTVIDDLVYEGNESVIVTLTGAAGTQLGHIVISGAATLTIADDDLPTLSIMKTADAAEPATNGGVTIGMAAGYTAASNITVNYTIGGTAINGTDYATLTGTAIIPAGANSINLPINVIDNLKIDGTRTVIFTLVNGTDGTNTFQPGIDYTTTVNITDNDIASFQSWKIASLPSTNRDGKVQPGEIITYKIYVRNTSNAAIGPLILTDKIPTNTNWESGWQLSSGVASLPITTIPAGGLVEVTFQVKTYENLDGVDWINNTAYVSDGINKLPTYACDPQTGTCDTVTRVPVRASKGDLSITKTTVSEGTFEVDDYITYKIVVKNIGKSTFTKLVITDSLPYNLDLPYNTTTTKGTAITSQRPNKVTWSVSELIPGDSVVITVTSRIMSGEEVVNTAYVVASEGEEDYGNNIAIVKAAVTKKDLYFINAFRPGGAQNNRFVIVGLENYPGSHLLVYSRWGNVVYESNNYNNDWYGDNLSTGEYIYKVIVPKKNGKVTYTGTVLIIK